MRLIYDISDGHASSMGWTYIFRSADGNFIKIGKTKKKLEYRLASVRNNQNYTQYDLSFLFAIEDTKFERILHKALEKYRCRFSWDANDDVIHVNFDSSDFAGKVKSYIEMFQLDNRQYNIHHINLLELKILRNLPPLADGEPRNYDHINTIDDCTNDQYFMNGARYTRLEVFKFETLLDADEIENKILNALEGLN